MPARVMSTVKLSARVVWSSPRDKVSLVSTRTSGSTAEAFKEMLAALSLAYLASIPFSVRRFRRLRDAGAAARPP